MCVSPRRITRHDVLTPFDLRVSLGQATHSVSCRSPRSIIRRRNRSSAA
ncbi:hypothetical protein FHS67_006483 [Aminobacter aminovorans]|nr:hypothetical protein [Aminobacter aminovorans]